MNVARPRGALAPKNRTNISIFFTLGCTQYMAQTTTTKLPDLSSSMDGLGRTEKKYNKIPVTLPPLIKSVTPY